MVSGLITFALVILLILAVRKNLLKRWDAQHRKRINEYFASGEAKKDEQKAWDVLRQLKWRNDTTPTN
jgi:hypothetical protein